ncbi:MAG: SRPBCC family protein [Crocinitomicaceae bacterium]|nr:SRPBCC family protein [Crocinitomicaceae bacterium]
MHQLIRKQFVKTDLNTCWDFFSSPSNLKVITPDYMGFDVKTEVPEKMYEGLIISYTVTPLLGIPMEWVTEITHINEKSFFVDEQRIGPYKMWHHEHHFKEINGGVEMTDIVSYVVPFGILGKLVQPILVQPKLEEIFAYRFKVVDNLFGA